MPSLDKRFTLMASTRKYFSVCKQIELLEQRRTDLNKRRKMAKKRKNLIFHHNLTMRRYTIEGMLYMYNFYAIEKLNEIAKLRQELFCEVDQSMVE